MKNKYALLFLVIAVVFIFIACFVIYGTPWGRNEFKKNVIKYLNEKYSQEMIVSADIHYSFEIGTYSVSVSPGDKKDITFAVWQTQDNKEKLGDNYFVQYWTYQANSQLNSYLTTAFPCTKVLGKMVIQQEPSLSLPSSQKAEPPSFNDIKDQLKSGTYIFIHFESAFNIEEMDKEYSNIYDIFSFIKQNGYTFDLIKVEYNNETQLRLNYTNFININDMQDLKRISMK